MLAFINTDTDNIIGIRIDGKISMQEFKAVTTIIKRRLQNHAMPHLYIEIVSLMGVTLSSLIDELKVGLKSGHRLERLALISDFWCLKNWNAFNERSKNGLSLKTFSLHHKSDAMEWIK